MKRQLVHTYNDIISLENLCLAWQEFIIVGKTSKPDVQQFGRNLMDHIVELHEAFQACSTWNFTLEHHHRKQNFG